jgi:hypothetical protein
VLSKCTCFLVHGLYTRGSLLIVTFLHASQNAWANLLSDNTLPPFRFTVGLTWMIALALILITKGQMGYEPAKNNIETIDPH